MSQRPQRPAALAARQRIREFYKAEEEIDRLVFGPAEEDLPDLEKDEGSVKSPVVLEGDIESTMDSFLTALADPNVSDDDKTSFVDSWILQVAGLP